jgi:Protein of unknown function (DUF2806)
VVDLPKLPGQELERAGAEILTGAGNVLFAAFRRRLEAWLGVTSARYEARAAEIEADSSNKRISASIEERRDQELREAVHRRHLQLLESALSDATLDDLVLDGRHLPPVSAALSHFESREFLKRGIGRSFDQITTEQRRVEAIAVEALQLVEADPEGDNPREIDDDWLMNFFKYASEVSEARVRQILLNRALADAAIKCRPIISPRALDTVRFFEKESLCVFKKVARHLSLFGAVPRNYFSYDQDIRELGQNLDMLNEMGLIRSDKVDFFTLEIGNFIVTFVYGASERFDFDTIKMTKIGRELAGLLDPTTRSLSKAFGFGSSHLDLWNLQQKLNISEQDVKNVTISLISDICDTWAFDIHVSIRRRDKPESVYNSYRANARDEIKIEIDPKKYFLDNYNESLVHVILSAFEYFNENQLPNLPERGQSNNFDADDQKPRPS